MNTASPGYPPQVLQLEEEHPPQDEPPIGVDMPLSPLEKEANRETDLGALFWHLGHGAPSLDCEKDRINSNLTLQSGQQYS